MKATTTSSVGTSRHLIKVLIAALLGASGGCAQLPRMQPSPAVKEVAQLGSAQSLAAPEAAWPGDGWWHVYQDPQLDALIEEALRESPDLDLAQARLAAARGPAHIAGATPMPEVTGNVLLNEGRQSYNSLIPPQALPHGWNDYGLATLNLSWELDFWGKNRSALAASMSER